MLRLPMDEMGASMGFFGTLIGWDQQLDAWNAALANDLVVNASPELKRELANRLVIIQQQVQGRAAGTPNQILEDLSRRTRIVQMNFVALACNSLGIPPRLRRAEFQNVSNPYRSDSESSRGRLPSCLLDLARRYGPIASWPGNEERENFSRWTKDYSASNDRESEEPDRILAEMARLVRDPPSSQPQEQRGPWHIIKRS